MMRAPAAALHSGEGQAGQANRGKNLEIEVGLPDFVGKVFELGRLRASGVVHQDIDAAQVGGYCRKYPADLIGTADVARISAAASAGRDDSAVSVRGSGRRATIATSAPEAANFSAIALPIPRLPPVISATLPSRRISICVLLLPQALGTVAQSPCRLILQYILLIKFPALRGS